jgi:5'-methylthioadenosine phosphorylase
MSTVPEVVLAREAGICYATIAMSTDYDCWHASEEPVTWEIIEKTMNRNVGNVKKLLFATIPKINDETCVCREAVKSSIL